MRGNPFNTGWTCRHLTEEGPGVPVTLPHDAMLGERRSETAAGGANTGWYEGYDYLYEKEFIPDSAWAGKDVILEFEGVYHNAEVWLGDHQIAARPYGYTNFYASLTPWLEAGVKNKLRVIARNADQPNSRWYSGAGIYRPVTLWVGEKEHILLNGVRIRTLSINPAVIEVTVRTNAPGPVKVEIQEYAPDTGHGHGEVMLQETVMAEWAGTGKGFPKEGPVGSGRSSVQKGSVGGKLFAQEGPAGSKKHSMPEEDVFEAKFSIRVPQVRLWNPGNPYLYNCHVTFRQDECEERFGIRTLSWGDRGFLVNEKRVILQGACIHHDNGLLGAVCDPDAVERKVRLLKENGYNALRSAHNPCSKALLDACDRLGMLVMDEYIDHWYIHKTEYDYVPYFETWWRRDLTDMVEKDYNHPCVVMYSTGNEVSETAQPRGIALTRQMTDFLHDLDDTRPVTCGVNIFFNFLSSVGFGVYSDKKAKKEAERAERIAGKAKQENGQAQKAAGKGKGSGRSGKAGRKKAVGSQFFNNLAGLLGDEFMKRGATLHGCDVKTRDAFAGMDIAGYNYGIYRYPHDLRKYPDRLILGTETFCNDAYRFRELSRQNPRILGDFVWAGMDYLGEVMVGSWEYKEYAARFDAGLGWVSAGSGRIDLTGKPLCEALYTRVALEKEKGPFLGVCPVNHTREKHSPSAWKMSNALTSWSWRGLEGRKAKVEVYARAEQVALFINGKEAGRKKKKDDCIFRFSCKYENGRIEAIAYDSEGRETGRTSLKTAGEETRLVAEPEEQSVKAGRLCYIRLRYTDEEGITKPMSRGLIKVEAEGGELLALGNACPYNERGYLSDETAPYYGEALAIVRAGTKDSIIFRASGGCCHVNIRIPVERAEADKAAADRMKADKAATDKAVADKAAADKTVADRMKADKAAADRMKADKAVADRMKADKTAADKTDRMRKA